MDEPQDMDVTPPRFSTAIEKGTVVDKDAWHNPDKRGMVRGSGRCGCTKTTDKGAYKDVTVEMPNGMTVHYYHQTPVVTIQPTDKGRRIKIRTGNWHTSSTRERINRYLPSGYYVVQRDYDWYLSVPNGGRLKYRDGMVLDTYTNWVQYPDGSHAAITPDPELRAAKLI